MKKKVLTPLPSASSVPGKAWGVLVLTTILQTRIICTFRIMVRKLGHGEINLSRVSFLTSVSIFSPQTINTWNSKAEKPDMLEARVFLGP